MENGDTVFSFGWAVYYPIKDNGRNSILKKLANAVLRLYSIFSIKTTAVIDAIWKYVSLTAVVFVEKIK